jgi:spore maturation protein SpmB
MAEYKWGLRSFLLAVLGLMLVSMCGALVMVFRLRKHSSISSFEVTILIIIGIGGTTGTFTVSST